MDPQNKNEKIDDNPASVTDALNYLSQKIDDQNKRIEALEKATYGYLASPSMMNADAQNAPVITPPPPSPEPFDQAPPSSPQKNLEENIGVEWFARIGITALILGISFFLKYAFDNNWIGPAGRVAIGIISGIILLGLGEKYIRKYSVYGQIMSGGGIAVLYLSIFAAFDFYHLIGQIPAFLFMILITASGIALSIRYDALALIVVAIVGGFATPFLVSTGKNNEIVLFTYALLLDIAILVVSVFKKWRPLSLVGFLGTIIIFTAWASAYYEKKELMVTMLFLTLFFIVFSIASLIYNLVRKEKSSGIEQMLTVTVGSIYFIASYTLMNHDYHVFMGFFAVILAIYYFFWAYFVKNITSEDKDLYNFLAFLTVGFVTLAIPIQFERFYITIGWIIEALLLLALGIKIKEMSIKAFSAVIFVFVFIRLVFFDSGYDDNSILIANKTFLIFLMAIGAFYLAAYMFKSWDTDTENNFLKRSQMIGLFLIVANFLSIFIGSREINHYYDEQINAINQQKIQEYNRPNQLRSGGSVYDNDHYLYSEQYRDQVEKMENRNSVLLSIYWLLYGIVLIAIGIIQKYKKVRLGGMLLFILAILKLFFYDLWSLGTLYRIISSISLGAVLLSISFAYQKYKDRLREII